MLNRKQVDQLVKEADAGAKALGDDRAKARVYTATLGRHGLELTIPQCGALRMIFNYNTGVFDVPVAIELSLDQVSPENPDIDYIAKHLEKQRAFVAFCRVVRSVALRRMAKLGEGDELPAVT